MKCLGDFDTSAVIYGKFTTFRPSTGAAYTLGGTPALSVYKDNSTTQSTTGVTLTADFDSVTGLNHFAIDTSADGTFYSAGSFFDIVITTGTVDSVSVVGSVVASFTLRKTSALKPTTAGRTLDVSAGGEAGIDWANVGTPSSTVSLTNTTIATVTTTTTATNVTTVNGLAANVITASSIAASALNGKGDWFLASSAPSNFSALAITAGGIVQADLQTIKTQTVTCSGGVTIPAATLASTTNITAGTITTVTNLTNAPTSGDLTAAMKASINTEVDTALADVRLDELLAADSDIDGAAPPTVGSVFHELMTKTAGSFTYDQTTDSLEALRDRGDAAWITATGFSTHSAADVWAVATRQLTGTQTFNLTGNITGNLSGSVGSVTGAVGSVTATVSAQLANGVTHGGTTAMLRLGSSSVTPALYITNSGGDAVEFTSSGGNGVYITSTVEDGLHILGATASINLSDGDFIIQRDVTVGGGVSVTNGITSNITGNITGNLSGSVGSVTGAVGSVTGNVGGNVVGSVASVTGAVGSVTGNVGGNVVGSVASVTGNVGGNVVGTIGGLTAAALKDFFDTDSTTTYASAVAGSVVKEITDNAGGGGLTVGAIADGVWDEVLSGHLTAGTTGNALNAAGSAGDPWSTTLPGSYTGTQAGFVFGTLRASNLNILSPFVAEDNSLELVIGDDYYAADSRNLQFTYGASPSLSGATVYLDIQTDKDSAFEGTNITSTTGSVSGTTTQLVSFDLPGTTTDDFDEGWRAYRVRAVLSNSHTVTLTRGRLNMLSRGNDAPV